MNKELKYYQTKLKVLRSAESKINKRMRSLDQKLGSPQVQSQFKKLMIKLGEISNRLCHCIQHVEEIYEQQEVWRKKIVWKIKVISKLNGE